MAWKVKIRCFGGSNRTSAIKTLVQSARHRDVA